MNLEDVPDLHFITLIQNVPSILERGILSHNEMERLGLTHTSIAEPGVQDRRANKVVPGNRRLHDFANLYFNARNPMMYLRQSRHAEMCVLRISVAVFQIQGVIIADRNAARELDWPRFEPSPLGLRLIEKEEVYAHSWDHADPIKKGRHKGIMCAEVLIPDRVNVEYIIGAYVSCEQSKNALTSHCAELDVKMKPYLFFQGGHP